MKKLIKLKKIHFFTFSFVILLMMAIGSFLYVKKVDTYIDVKLKVSSYRPVFIISNSDIYKIKKDQEIVIKINNQVYYGKFKKITYDSEKKVFKGELYNFPIRLVPNSTLDVKIIYGEKRLYEQIIG